MKRFSKPITVSIVFMLIFFIVSLSVLAVDTAYYRFNKPDKFTEISIEKNFVAEGISDLHLFSLSDNSDETFRIFTLPNGYINSEQDLNDVSLIKIEDEIRKTALNQYSAEVRIILSELKTAYVDINSVKTVKISFNQSFQTNQNKNDMRQVEYMFYLKDKVVCAQFTLAMNSQFTDQDIQKTIDSIKITGNKLPKKEAKQTAPNEISTAIKVVIFVSILLLLILTIIIVILVLRKTKNGGFGL